MNKKTIIQVIIIILCFGGAGFVLYNGMFKKNGSTAEVLPATVMNGNNSKEASNLNDREVLPYGPLNDDAFDKVLKKQKFNFGGQNYPKLDPGSDLGVWEDRLVPPLEKKSVE